MIKKLSYKDYNKQITTRDNGIIQSHDQEESKLNNTIIANSGVHTLTHDQIIKKAHSIRITELIVAILFLLNGLFLLFGHV